ncbi:flagellar motor switch protein FliM [Microbulbifer thermotolerans]|uniref:Flagellar motor switch protein FliM n=1 Tax=Microbulbifer thermotolerans TaxID=252514 RepID=A0AB35I0B1_MICTH|nr:flagellar motor switch protein FliM [Microbulbifer thermotolerans]MCX2780117.1 flagellar motor switch protein FliM [Microbulbifer thermotolerans]MCX2802143.1 flagellar motor switch protein FliM [Microbulbifer thermotolerans]MCX2805541.1 flagellar motor switch protein FliM [Microbulbifer thermotolerans]MCX2831932.1 flagellar motor switch protein FliM [Microbulbifer thermotolerans]MCX2842503.1 flagellar motor switch protein FliM [Microbulbifer thermotolerans]
MAQDELLSQEEIDALLHGPGDNDNADGDSDAPHMRPYDPATQQRVIRERLHGMDIINERFARHFRVSLFNLIRRSADITVESVRYQSFKDFARNLPVPTNLNLISMKPLRGTGLMVFPPSMVFMVVDSLFGGDGRFVTRLEGREFTNTEQRVIQRILRLAINAYQHSWQSVYELDISYLRSELQARFANITNSPNEIIVNTTFSLDVGNLSDHFQICMPYSMIEPLRDRLVNPIVDGRSAGDKSWNQRMAGEIRQSKVELVAEFASLPSRIGAVMKLKRGDILPLELPDTVTARVDGVPVLECEYGSRNGQRALRVTRLIERSGGRTLLGAGNFIEGAVPKSEESEQ